VSVPLDRHAMADFAAVDMHYPLPSVIVDDEHARVR
jgi:hypothetical protein